MNRFLIAAVGLLLLCGPAAAQQGATVNPTVGAMWTYLGPTFGADWSVGPGTMGTPPTDINELTIWNAVNGTRLRQGPPGVITDNKTAPITAESGTLTARSTNIFTASQIFDAALLLPPGAGGKTYDAMRAISFGPADTTINLISGVAAYVVSDALTRLDNGGFPAAVGLFAAGVARGTGAKVWGVNTLLSDSFGGPVETTGPGKSLNNEFDFNISSPDTTILGLQIAGGGVVQPASAHAVVLQPWYNLGVGPLPKWTAFLQSNAGATNIFAGIGPKEPSGTSIKSQDIYFAYKTSTGTDGSVIMTGSEAGGIEIFSGNSLSRAVSILGGSGRFSVQDTGGFTINERIVMQGIGTNFGVGAATEFTTQTYSNASATTTILGASIQMNTLPTSAGGGGLTVCIDAAGILYKKATCP